jgi:glycosyltransferase involved in cell wall biosynthesis
VKPLRILFVSHDAGLYGAQRSLHELIKVLPRDRFSPVVALPYDGDLRVALERDGVRVHTLPFGWWVPTKASWRPQYFARYPLRCAGGTARLARLIGSERPDVVYSNTITIVEGAIAAFIRRVPHVWHVREGIDNNPQLVSLLNSKSAYRLVRRLSAAVVFNSFALRRSYGAIAERTGVVVHNGIELRAAADVSIRHANSPLHRVPIILVVGYMDERKGLDVLLDAARLLLEKGYDFEIRVAGAFSPTYEAQQIAPRLSTGGIAQRVNTLGWIPDMRQVYLDADILVCSSRQEAFGRSLIEAMECGIPVVATRSGGPEEIVEDGVTGLLVPCEDPRGLASAISRLLDEPLLARTMGQRGRQRAETLFTLGAAARSIASILESAAAGAIGGYAT